MENYFVTAIGTDSGKTIASAILCEALNYNYWKPIQCGAPYDTGTIKALVSNKNFKCHEEAYVFTTPASPHQAARIENVEINLNHISNTAANISDNYIAEGAGGVCVPLNQKDLIVDLISELDIQVILVADLYLGSINHTLLTINELKRRSIKVKGIIFNGESNNDSEQIILKHSQYKKLLHILPEKAFNKATVSKYADILKKDWDD